MCKRTSSSYSLLWNQWRISLSSVWLWHSNPRKQTSPKIKWAEENAYPQPLKIANTLPPQCSLSSRWQAEDPLPAYSALYHSHYFSGLLYFLHKNIAAPTVSLRIPVFGFHGDPLLSCNPCTLLPPTHAKPSQNPPLRSRYITHQPFYGFIAF